MRQDTSSKYKSESSISSFMEEYDSEDHFNLIGEFDLASIIDCGCSIHCCKYHPNGDLIAVGLSDGSIKLYKKPNYELVYVLMDEDVRLTRLPVTSVKFFNPPGDVNQDHYKILVATYVAGYIKFWHYPSKSCIYTITDKELQPLTLDFNVKYTNLVVGGYDEKIRVYDVATKKLINTLENNGFGLDTTGHSNRVYCVKYNPNEVNQMYSGGWDDTIHVWDDRIPNSVKYIYGPHICGDAIDIDTNYNHLITGSWKKTETLQIWDMRSMRMIRDVFKNKSNQMIYGVQWLGRSYIFTCGTQKNSAVIYDRSTLKTMGSLTELKYAVTNIDNDRVGDLPNLIAASENRLFVIKKKNFNARR